MYINIKGKDRKFKRNREISYKMGDKGTRIQQKGIDKHARDTYNRDR